MRDGNPPQQSVVHVDGARAVLTTVLKTGSASTLDIVQGVKDALPKIQTTLPSTFKISLLNDQSIFVKAAISGVVPGGICFRPVCEIAVTCAFARRISTPGWK